MGIYGAAPVDEAMLELTQRGVNGVLRRPPGAVRDHVDRLPRRHLAFISPITVHLRPLRHGRLDLARR